MRSIEPEKLGKRSREVAEFYLSHPSMTRQEIAKAMGISGPRVTTILAHPKVQRAFPILARQRVTDRLLPKSLQAYERLLDRSQNDAVVEKVAARVLSSENVFDAPKITIENTITLKTIDELRLIVENATQTPIAAIEAEIVPDKEHSQ